MSDELHCSFKADEIIVSEFVHNSKQSNAAKGAKVCTVLDNTERGKLYYSNKSIVKKSQANYLIASSNTSEYEEGFFMTEECDVLIVGGGPAGLATAEAASKLNVRTIVLERQNEIGYPVHTSGGSWISDMKALAIPENLYHPITKVMFVSPHREVPLYYNPAVACVLDVSRVYPPLACRAIASS